MHNTEQIPKVYQNCSEIILANSPCAKHSKKGNEITRKCYLLIPFIYISNHCDMTEKRNYERQTL